MREAYLPAMPTARYSEDTTATYSMRKRLALSRLFQLTSTMLPVGAYSYSQGLEWAIECGDVKTAADTQAWISDVLDMYIASFELPVVYRLYQAWRVQLAACLAAQDPISKHANIAPPQPNAELTEWDAYYQAGRDTAESLAETRQMGYSLCRLLNDLQALPPGFMSMLNALEQPAYPTVYAGVAYIWEIDASDLLHAYAWSWLENQVAAAMKTVPLGQVAGQKILLALGQQLPQTVTYAMQLQDDQLSNFAPGLTIAGCLHETQYSRLFRS